jgi:hypothetical protein
MQHPDKTLVTYFETAETFKTYACNISLWTMQLMQHLDKTFATYV